MEPRFVNLKHLYLIITSCLFMTGGSLTAWGVTKTKNRFKAAIVGAGASNWEGMVMDSGSPELEVCVTDRHVCIWEKS